MKKLLSLLVILSLITGAHAQNATVSNEGNYVAINHQLQGHDSAVATGKTFTDLKGNVYPVWRSRNGKLYYFRTSKAGNVYRAYLKLEEKVN